MLDWTRIPPVDIESLPDDLREVLEEQRKLHGAPLYPQRMRCGPPSSKRRSACAVRSGRCSTVASPRGTIARIDRTPMLP